MLFFGAICIPQWGKTFFTCLNIIFLKTFDLVNKIASIKHQIIDCRNCTCIIPNRFCTNFGTNGLFNIPCGRIYLLLIFLDQVLVIINWYLGDKFFHIFSYKDVVKKHYFKSITIIGLFFVTEKAKSFQAVESPSAEILYLWLSDLFSIFQISF